MTSYLNNIFYIVRIRFPIIVKSCGSWVRRFTLAPSKRDIIIFLLVTFILSIFLTALTAKKIGSFAPVNLMVNEYVPSCSSHRAPSIQCDIRIGRAGQEQLLMISLGSNGTRKGVIRLYIGKSVHFQVTDVLDVVDSEKFPIIVSSVISSMFKLKTIEVKLKPDGYLKVFRAAIVDVNKSSEAGWNDKDITNTAKVLYESSLKDFIDKSEKLVMISPFLGVIPYIMYFLSYFSILGIIFVAACVIHCRKKLKKRIGSSDIDPRISMFVYVVNSLPAIGLIGTVLGAITALGAFNKIDSPYPIVDALASAQMDTGFQLALYTTLLGIACSVIIHLFVIEPVKFFAFKTNS